MSFIRIIQPFIVPYTEPNDHDSTRYVCLVRIVDSDGVEGWGEAATLFLAATSGTEALIRDWATLVIGLPARSGEVFEELRRATWWYGDAGLACFARAAIDMALWDLEGKRSSLSLAEMLGQVTSELPVLLSCHATGADFTKMSVAITEQVHQTQAIGVKVGFGKRGDANLGFETSRDEAFVRELRATLGEDLKIMIDIGATISWNLQDALQRVRAFEDFNVDWIEEPLGARHEDYPTLYRHSNSRIAYGEREWSPYGYEEILKTGAIDVVGIDPGRALGVTGFSETTRLLEKYQVQGNAHAFSGPMIFAASLALSLSSPAFKQLELMPLRNSLYDLVEGCPKSEEGRVQASGRPGLGIEVSLDKVRERALNG